MESKKAKMIAKDLMSYHGLFSWKFAFDKALVRFGCCHTKKQMISLSLPLLKLNDESKVIDIILHEIAHALAPHREGHGHTWKHIASSIGCTATRCYDDKTITPQRSYIGTCPTCHRTVKRHRRKRISCGICGCDQFNSQFLFTWKEA